MMRLKKYNQSITYGRFLSNTTHLQSNTRIFLYIITLQFDPVCVQLEVWLNPFVLRILVIHEIDIYLW